MASGLTEWIGLVWTAAVALAGTAFTGFVWLFTLASQVKTTTVEIKRLEREAEKGRTETTELLRELRDDVKWLMKNKGA